MKPWPAYLLRWLMTIGLHWGPCWTGSAFAEARSIEQFVAQREKWSQLVGTQWTVEGRYAVLGTNALKFMNCDLQFRLAEGLPRIPSQTNVVEATGILEKEGSQLVFRVTALRVRPSDLETVRLKRGAIDPRVPKNWYDVGEWARSRSRFYKDDALMAEALLMFTEGIEVERRQLPASEVAGLFALAKRAEELGVGTQIVNQLKHEAFRRQFDQSRNQPRADLSGLLGDISRQLPGAAERLSDSIDAEPDPIDKQYRQDPLGSYRLANAEQRSRLNRLLYLEVAESHFRKRLAADGHNGFELARDVDLRAPELASLAENFRNQQQQAQLSRIATLTRQELFEFVQRAESRQQEELARNAKRQWLEARQPRLRADGPRGLVELGEDWFSLLNDEKGAAQFFIEAFNANPDYAPAADWLTAHGYVYVRGNWLSKAEAANKVESRDLAIREGRVQPGMTETEVRSALGASPNATYRLASSAKIIDLWVFNTAGIVVRFERRPEEPTATAATIEPLPQPSSQTK